MQMRANLDPVNDGEEEKRKIALTNPSILDSILKK